MRGKIAEARIGEILEKIDRKYVGYLEGTNIPKQEKTLPSGITKKLSHQFQLLAGNKDLIEEVATELYIAREKLRVPEHERGKSKDGDKSPDIDKTWSDYCNEIGSDRQASISVNGIKAER